MLATKKKKLAPKRGLEQATLATTAKSLATPGSQHLQETIGKKKLR
jgi:hypothetical protein